MIHACLAALWSHWRRNPLQLFAYFAGLALATALWSGVQAINSEARASYDAAASTLGDGQFDQLVPRQGDGIELETYVALRRAGWLVSPVVEGRLEGVRLIGIDPLTSPTGLGIADLSQTPDFLDAEGADQLVANAQTAQVLEGKATLRTDATIAPGIAVGDIATVQEMLGTARLSRLLVLPEQPIGRPDLETVASDLMVQPAQQVADIGQLTDSFHLNLTAFGLLSFAVGLFIVHSTIGLAFEQRRGMIRILRSLGVPLRMVVALIAIEMMTLAAIGAGVGIVLGYIIAALLLPDVAATLRGLYGAEISGVLGIRTEWWLSGLLIALFGTAFALAGRIWQIVRMPLLASGRPRAWVMASASRFKVQTAAAFVLLTATGALALFGSGLYAGFALLGCLLIGAALALPVLASLALSWVQGRGTAPVWQWFWADTRQQLPGLSLALMALLLAVSANIGVSTMVSSFRLTFVGFLDQRLAPELFVQVETADQSAALLAMMARDNTEVLPLVSTRGQVAGQTVELYGVRVGPTYRDAWVFLDAQNAAWDAVADGTAVVVNEQLARRSNLWVGDSVDIANDLTLPIAAVVGDYGNPQGQVVMSEDVFIKLHPELVPLRFGIRTQNASELRSRIVDQVGISDSAIVDQASIKALSLEVFERTFTVTAALNVLTLLVAGFAILMSLLTLADLRLPQLAPVWALGLTRRELGLLELLRAVAFAALVFVLAVPLGLALAWVLLSVINVEAFGWRLPMFLFPFEYFRLGLYAMVAAFLAAAWPALRLMRTPPSALLKVFANER
ncbi:Permease [Sulfitobacter noctilucicola]|uniref:Putative ABC transport system permease protein n=1 Tax=Sulfitobacter noctilucicola TaxID=1342301 RepID=A0A7W6MAK8_9RHOB|nr:FtsX-like permease family protein [Sulfitobacter noctilucicola]KIN63948.1 Permease [Sulfitobacter noctilucicola]MBB4175306.1 putative ABC transport system permease protein [Sulfitobacter noctilucicola]